MTSASSVTRAFKVSPATDVDVWLVSFKLNSALRKKRKVQNNISRVADHNNDVMTSVVVDAAPTSFCEDPYFECYHGGTCYITDGGKPRCECPFGRAVGRQCETSKTYILVRCT